MRDLRLQRSFYIRPTEEVARDLLGKYLVYEHPQGRMVGEINEVEVYTQDDPASHAFVGKTQRTSILFGQGGFAYVYFIYGMYFCFNVTAEIEGKAGAVLVRSVIPHEGIELMRRLCGKSAEIEARKLTNGPGKLCRAFGLTREENGVDLVSSNKLFIEDHGRHIAAYQTTQRIGITKAVEKLWRFVYL